MLIKWFMVIIEIKDYRVIVGTIPATASRDIAELLRLVCIEEVEETDGRNVWYRVVLDV